MPGKLPTVKNSDNPSLLFENLRHEKQTITHKKPRNLIRSDFVSLPLTSLPQSVKIVPGQLEVSFETIGELAESLLQIAGILTHEGDLFAARYEPQKKPKSDLNAETEEVRRMFVELEERERLNKQMQQAEANAGGGLPLSAAPAR